MKQQNRQSEPSSALDGLKWFLVIAVVLSGVVANYYYQTQPLALRLIGWIALAVVAGIIALTTNAGGSFIAFAKDSRTELRKVVWPTRDETVQTTMMVVLFVIVLSLILWCIDAVLLHLMGILTGQTG